MAPILQRPERFLAAAFSAHVLADDIHTSAAFLRKGLTSPSWARRHWAARLRSIGLRVGGKRVPQQHSWWPLVWNFRQPEKACFQKTGQKASQAWAWTVLLCCVLSFLWSTFFDFRNGWKSGSLMSGSLQMPHKMPGCLSLPLLCSLPILKPTLFFFGIHGCLHACAWGAASMQLSVFCTGVVLGSHRVRQQK